jgi:hypothetical protein
VCAPYFRNVWGKNQRPHQWMVIVGPATQCSGAQGPFGSSDFKTGPAKLHGRFRKRPFCRIGLWGSFGTCPFSKQHLSRRVTPLSFILALCLSTFLSFLLLLYPPMSASQENITLATSLKLKIPGKSAQSHTKQDFCADMMGMRLESCMQL